MLQKELRSSKRPRAESPALERPSSPSWSGDVVSVRFMTPPATFRFLRGTLFATAPGSIFAHHFSPRGLNEGKDPLPSSDEVDRDPAIFDNFFKPVMQGYPKPLRSEWDAKEETVRRKVESDAAFYGFEIDQIVDAPKPTLTEAPESAKVSCLIQWTTESLEEFAGIKRNKFEYNGSSLYGSPVVRSLRIWRTADKRAKARFEVAFQAKDTASLEKMEQEFQSGKNTRHYATTIETMENEVARTVTSSRFASEEIDLGDPAIPENRERILYEVVAMLAKNAEEMGAKIAVSSSGHTLLPPLSPGQYAHIFSDAFNDDYDPEDRFKWDRKLLRMCGLGKGLEWNDTEKWPENAMPPRAITCDWDLCTPEQEEVWHRVMLHVPDVEGILSLPSCDFL